MPKLKIKPVKSGGLRKAVVEPETKIVKATLSKIECEEWDIGTYISYFEFLSFFYSKETPYPFKLTKENVEDMQVRSLENELYTDFLERIDAWQYEGYNEKYNRRFHMRFLAMFAVVQKVIKEKPERLPPATVLWQMKNNKHLKFLKEVYDDAGNPLLLINRNITQAEHIEMVNNITPYVPEDGNPTGILLEAMGRVADIYNKIAISVTDKEIAKLDIKDKIAALQKLSYIHTTTKKMKPNMNFIKIDASKGTAESLEAALLGFNNDEENLNE